MADPGGLPLDYSRPVPPKRSGQRGPNLYDRTVQTFIASSATHAAVGGESKPDTRYVALRKSIVRLGVTEEVGVSMIAGDVWLYAK